MIAPVLATALAMAILFVPPAGAQTFQVLHSFTGRDDGAYPMAGLIIDQAGNLYGTASGGGVIDGCQYGCGVAFRLKRAGAGWIFTPLHGFQGGSRFGLDGGKPEARMVFAADGELYGTTAIGGGNLNCNGDSCGTVFSLSPPPTTCATSVCAWDETVVYRFLGPPYAGVPNGGPLVFDRQGNLYGAAGFGANGFGAVYELSNGGGTWSENDIAGAGESSSGVVFDNAGNLYGSNSGDGYGGVYQLVPSGSGWTFNQLFSILDIPDDGFDTVGGVILDSAGNVYASTVEEGPNQGGTVFELSAGTWNFNLLYGFSGGGGPEESLTMDSAGNLYGTTYEDGAHGWGNVFKLTPSANGWIYTDLYDFTGGSDGKNPVSNIVFDAQGNLYGTASAGGSGCSVGCGTIWEITP